MKKQYFLMVDVETANDTTDSLVYDLGFAVTDRQGNIYETQSLIISEIFYGESDLMQSAYYAKKIPMYLQGIKDKKFQVVNFYTARVIVLALMKKYNIKTVMAYNANFDMSALNTTQRFLTKSKYRFFFPYGTKFQCVWSMACQVLYTQTRFVKFANDNGYMSKAGNLQTSAEIGYRYLTGNDTFEEDHTGLSDVLIEVQIMAKCISQKKAMKRTINRYCWTIPQKKRKEMQASGRI